MKDRSKIASKLVFCIPFLLILSLSACVHRQTLLFYNESNEAVQLEVKGVQLYGKGRGFHDFMRIMPPCVNALYTTRSPIVLTYPVEVRWKSLQSQKQGQERMPLIPGTYTNLIEQGGILEIGLTEDFKIGARFGNSDEEAPCRKLKNERLFEGTFSFRQEK